MKFVDEVEIVATSGKGGRGCSSFRREKYVAFGGPDGGDGGRGGHVYLVADRAVTTLYHLRHQTLWRAQPGEPGGTRLKTGSMGEDTRIRVPVGTIVRLLDDEGEPVGDPLFELLLDGDERLVAEGGKGGLGNTHFKTSTNRAPRKTTPGGPAQELRLRLELKLVADVGLLGFPNAGKSTLISTISAARPRIADYPFTTLVPHLGVVSMGTEGEFVVADIPGLIEGAAEGKGLGLRFLRHVERTRMLLHLVSLSEQGDPLDRWRILRRELREYDPALAERPEIVVLTQVDAAEPELVAEARAAFTAELGAPPFVISAVTREGVPELVRAVWERLRPEPADEPGGV
jgi:GTP-binding protein